MKNLQLPYKACNACVSVTSPGIIGSASDADNDNAFGQAYISDGPSGPKMVREREVSYPRTPPTTRHTPHPNTPKILKNLNDTQSGLVLLGHLGGPCQHTGNNILSVWYQSYCIQNVCLTTSDLGGAPAKATWASARIFGAAGPVVEHWH